MVGKTTYFCKYETKFWCSSKIIYVFSSEWRMSVQQFDNLHNLLKSKLWKRSRREPLPTEIRIAVTLRLVYWLYSIANIINIVYYILFKKNIKILLQIQIYFSFLAHGDSVTITSLFFRIGRSILYNIIPEVCNAIWEVLQSTYLRCP